MARQMMRGQDPVMLCCIAIIIVIVTLIMTLIYKLFFAKHRRSNKIAGVANTQPQRAPIVVGGRRQVAVRRRTGALVNNRERGEAARRNHDDEDDFNDNASEPETFSGALDEDLLTQDAKIGKKKLAKLQAKAEKRAQREAEMEEREERQQREKAKEEARKLHDEKERLEEQAKEEAERKEKEEKERHEYEQYLKLKEEFSIDEEGFDVNDEAEHENMLQEFVNFIKKTKVVSMDELASEWKLRPRDVVDRVKMLVANGTLTGVIDDRGKFIYVTPEELKAVAKFINQRGRVSVTELAEYSNKLINLEPDYQHVDA